MGFLLQGPFLDILWTIITAFIGIAALASGIENRLFRKTAFYERIMLIIAGLMLVYPTPLYDAIGIGLIIIVVILQKIDLSRTFETLPTSLDRRL